MSRDPNLQRAAAQVFAGIDLHVSEDAVSALELISRSHFDGFIVDCDGMKHGTEIIAGVRSQPSQSEICNLYGCEWKDIRCNGYGTRVELRFRQATRSQPPKHVFPILAAQNGGGAPQVLPLSGYGRCGSGSSRRQGNSRTNPERKRWRTGASVVGTSAST